MLAPKTFHPDIRSSFVVVVLKMPENVLFFRVALRWRRTGCFVILFQDSHQSSRTIHYSALAQKKLCQTTWNILRNLFVELSVMYSMSWYRMCFFKIIFGMAEVFNVFLYSPSTYDFVPLVDVFPKPDFCSSSTNFVKVAIDESGICAPHAEQQSVSHLSATPDMLSAKKINMAHGFFQLIPVSWCAWWNCQVDVTGWEWMCWTTPCGVFMLSWSRKRWRNTNATQTWCDVE